MHNIHLRTWLRPLFTSLILCTLTADSSLLRAQDSDYVLVFSDEFNEPNGSEPDSTKWNRHTRYDGIWSRWISDSPEVAFIKNGRLVLKAIPNKTASSDTAQMLTGAINTRNKFEFQYGKVEARMKTNIQEGNFSAIWMRNNAIAARQTYGEIDIFEAMGNRKEAQMGLYSDYTYRNPHHHEKTSHREKTDIRKWHIYSIEWTPTYILWGIDGNSIFFYEKSKDSTLLSKNQWSFDTPYYLILNQSVGDGRWTGMQPHTDKTYTTLIDWIHVFQRRP